MSFIKTILVTLVCCCLLQTAYAQIKKDETDPLGFGIKIGGNIPTLGFANDNYSGLAGTTIGLFFSKPINQHFSWFVEPAFSSARFRDKSTEIKFNNYYIDAGAFVYFYPSAYNTDFAFMGGLRPSYMIAYNSQAFELGQYNNKSFGYNKNEVGRIDATAMLGVSVALSPIVNLELVYNYGLTNKNTDNQILGRPSTFDFNLRINAVALKRSLDNKTQSVEQEVQDYHKGVLLVMLITPNEKEINRLKTANRNEDAELIVSEISIRNEKVIKEFNKNFSFTPVFYFMDTSIYKVISGNLNGVFVNYNLQSDTSIKVNTDNFFIASFCEDISDYTKRKHFGLFVYDKQMNQLEKPFNHPNQLASPVFDYVVVNNKENKTRRPSYATVPFEKLIGKLNTRLFRYLN